MEERIQRTLEEARAEVARARAEIDRYSKQPRFAENDTSAGGDFFFSTYRWVDDLENQEPPYLSNSRKRDEWLREFVRKEPHLLGVLNSVVAVDKNRGWSLTGGRNQVVRFTDVFHNWEGAPGMIGWRAGISSAASAFYNSDLGAIIEVGREGNQGPLRGMYHTDPVRCMLTGNGEKPLSYYPPRGKKQDWGYQDFMRIVSMPSTDETYNGLGLCAVSRAVLLARILIAIYQHDLEQLGAKAPRGLLLLKGITQPQWDSAMRAREAVLEGDQNRRYFDAVAVLASGSADVDAKLVALSQLPVGFERRTFTDLLMFGYALVFGYDPIEFWPVQFGALGRGNETQVQHDKATGKGGLDFALSFQEQLQENLPDTLQWDIDQRDQEADMLLANIHSAWGDAVSKISAFLTPDEARLLLAEHEVIPHEWTDISFEAENEDTEGEVDSVQDEDEQRPGSGEPNTDDSESSDTDTARARRAAWKAMQRQIKKPTRTWLKRERDRLREQEPVWRAAEAFPNDPIVCYEWPRNRTMLLWERGADVTRREIFPVARVQRADSPVLYQGWDFSITQDDVDRAISEGQRRVGIDFAAALENPVITGDTDTTEETEA